MLIGSKIYLTIPVTTALPPTLQTYGPPESPWQESLPPCGKPAQNIASVICPGYDEPQETGGTRTHCKSPGR